LPVDALKIDPSLVRDLGRDQGGASTISTMIAMGKNLHMRVVAEGVETQQQLELLQQSGCPQAQGFYFGRPVPAEEFHRLLKCKGSATASA
jgi:EAL domain-containing protein (putative c-di-GMP-specific phosphodiesterase class I)